MKKTLNFLNRQLVRVRWGYDKVGLFIGLVNTTSLIVTALAVSKLVIFTWQLVVIFMVGIVLIILTFIYTFVRLGVLQDENRQVFRERLSMLWKDQQEYHAILVVFYLKNPEKMEERKKQLEKRLF